MRLALAVAALLAGASPGDPTPATIAALLLFRRWTQLRSALLHAGSRARHGRAAAHLALCRFYGATPSPIPLPMAVRTISTIMSDRGQGFQLADRGGNRGWDSRASFP